MKIVRTIKELQDELEVHRSIGSIGLVPTMGALHKGHLTLVEQCRKENDCVVVSIFVNPTQFNDKNDLKNYPRCESADCELLERAGCDIAFIPSVEEVYPEPDMRVFDFGELDKVMEGANRPGHFNGVAQIVSKLFYITNPRRAYFGEKDYQQLAIIRDLAGQLSLDVEIIGVPIVRERDGLAMSSRNMLLTPEQRAAAPKIYGTLKKYTDAGRRYSIKELTDKVIGEIDADPLMETEYFTIADAETLQPLKEWPEGKPARGFAVVRMGNVRLIDNLEF